MTVQRLKQTFSCRKPKIPKMRHFLAFHEFEYTYLFGYVSYLLSALFIVVNEVNGKIHKFQGV